MRAQPNGKSSSDVLVERARRALKQHAKTSPKVRFNRMVQAGVIDAQGRPNLKALSRRARRAVLAAK